MAGSDLWGDLGYAAPKTAAPTNDPAALKGFVTDAATKYGIPPDLADRWVQQESGYNPTAKSKKGALGLTQLMDGTAKTYGVTDPTDPAQNVEGGAHYLSDLHAKYGDWSKALAAYNAGPDAVDKAGGVPNYPETQAYVKAIMTEGSTPAGGSDLWGSLGYTQVPAAPETAQMIDMHPTVPISKLTPAQQKTRIQREKGGLGVSDEVTADGSESSPFYETPDHPAKDAPPGSYYVPLTGGIKRAPGGPAESSLAEGLGQGVADVAASVGNLLPGTGDSEILNRLNADQQIHDAKYGGDKWTGAGRFGGQLLASAPLLAGGEAALAPVLENAGPVGTFIAGRGGLQLDRLTGKVVMKKGLAGLTERGGSLATAGAATGAGAAALTSSTSDAPLPQQIGAGAVGGALLGPVAPAIEGAGGKAVQGIKSLVKPLTQGGRESIANDVLGKFTRGPIGTPNPGVIIPGSVPTLATASADPGLATLERTVRLGPHGDLFAARDAANHQARAEFFDKLSGDEDSIQALRDAREAATGGARDAALAAQTQPADIKPVLDTIDTILKGPEGKRSEVVKALTEVRDNLHDTQGNPETDAAMLYGVRKGIGDLLSPKASSEKSGAKLAASQLGDVKSALDAAIQNVAPGFKEYLKNYADLSKPIDEQQLLQGLKIADMRGNITLAKAQGALDKVTAMRAKPGANPAKSVSNDTLAALTALRDDLKRGDNINLARPIGPDTAQHFSTGGRLRQAGIPLGIGLAIGHHPVGATALGGANLFYGMKDKEIMARVAQRLLNPQVTPIRPAMAQAKEGLIKRLGSVVPAATGGMLSTRLIPAQ